ncbi:MAG: ABC transporter permease [Clostridia bacterium]|nr:ABC transporter permease [Clostridia bacterium]
MASSKIKFELPFHITKRTDIPGWKAWLFRGGAIVIAFILTAIVSTILTKGGMGGFFKEMFVGTMGTANKALKLLNGWAMLLMLGLALVPAFKMKFWNIGAEGQTLMGALASVVVIKEWGKVLPEEVLIILMLLFSLVFGAIWGLIPAIFKAIWNTNETLFTLMMNYIAIQMVLFAINIWAPNGSGTIGILKYGSFSGAFGMNYIINIVLVTIVTAILFVYIKYSKHGYEINVVGESVNTAKYIGINVKSVIIRTMVLSGALCGLAGWFLVGGSPTPTINSTLVAGRGFTAILVAWIGQLNPFIMMGSAFLVIFMQTGAAQVATTYHIGSSSAYSGIVVGLFFVILIAAEFLVNYNVVFKVHKHKKVEKAATPTGEKAGEEPTKEDEKIITEEQFEEELESIGTRYFERTITKSKNFEGNDTFTPQKEEVPIEETVEEINEEKVDK